MPANRAAPAAPMVPVTTPSPRPTGDGPKRRACVSCTTAKIRRLDGLQARFDDLEARLSDNSSSFIDGATISSTSSRPVEQCAPSSLHAISPVSHQTLPQQDPQKPASTTSGLNNGYVDIVARGIIAEERAEALLTDFRRYYVPFFPFVSLSSDDTASKLRQESPLLFLVAVSVALCAEPSLQRLLGEEFRGMIGSQLFKEGDGGWDALRALLVYAAWHTHFAASQVHSQLFLYAQLCVSLVYHLNLDSARPTISTEEIRALLGTYWLSTCASRAFRRPPVMRYNKRMEESCERLAAAPEYETDRLIRPLVLLETLCARVSDAFNADNLAAKAPLHGDAIIGSVVDGFVDELESIKTLSNTETWSLANKNRMLMEFNYVESYVREGAFNEELWNVGPQAYTLATTQSPSMPTSHTGGHPPFIRSPVRIAMLWQMLDTDKACIRHYMAFTAAELHRTPVTVNVRACYALANLIRLIFTLMDHVLVPPPQPSTRNADAAHATAVLASESTNVMRIIDDLAAMFEVYPQLHHADAGGRHPIVMSFAFRLKRLSHAYRHKLQEIVAGLGPSHEATELMADCGGLRPTQSGQADRLHTGNNLSEKPLAPAQERTTRPQPDPWSLSEEELSEFNTYNDREWASIFEATTLPE
ncbi:hypothetical protein SPI_07007 [Niveomyces insectorum RCEF 264]|uniref:Fungal transcriptional regulatory protein n=1 Tax=Niveomyces insectorum RCEF 264 TaxID=1081102 RepID=A0A167QZC1_9HYPO|nr:hypothetical protein SPI_07007 [Niveomyces insectorum RCEF 264]